jgi:hypothetical protein
LVLPLLLRRPLIEERADRKLAHVGIDGQETFGAVVVGVVRKPGSTSAFSRGAARIACTNGLGS